MKGLKSEKAMQKMRRGCLEKKGRGEKKKKKRKDQRQHIKESKGIN